ncbi:alpha/beta fold hydrolase [Microbacterium sp. NPDC076768]|uniref:thioesterase II family protein n=1 Tax=Microbacterium sp. NPDC076768 TaxID=3154858 RepID=UPI00343468B4
MHLFCLHHAGGTTASFAAWRFPGITVTKLSYRGRDFSSVSEASDVIAHQVAASPSPSFAIYGHSMGAILAFEAAIRLQESGRVNHVFLAASPPPSMNPEGGNTDADRFGAMSERAREVLLEDLALLATYPGRPPMGQLKVPATIFYSSDDLVVSASEFTRWASWCAMTPRLVDVSVGGHLFHRTSSDVLQVVEETLSPGAHVVSA